MKRQNTTARHASRAYNWIEATNISTLVFERFMHHQRVGNFSEAGIKVELLNTGTPPSLAPLMVSSRGPFSEVFPNRYLVMNSVRFTFPASTNMAAFDCERSASAPILEVVAYNAANNAIETREVDLARYAGFEIHAFATKQVLKRVTLRSLSNRMALLLRVQCARVSAWG